MKEIIEALQKRKSIIVNEEEQIKDLINFYISKKQFDSEVKSEAQTRQETAEILHHSDETNYVQEKIEMEKPEKQIETEITEQDTIPKTNTEPIGDYTEKTAGSKSKVLTKRKRKHRKTGQINKNSKTGIVMLAIRKVLSKKQNNSATTQEVLEQIPSHIIPASKTYTPYKVLETMITKASGSYGLIRENGTVRLEKKRLVIPESIDSQIEKNLNRIINDESFTSSTPKDIQKKLDAKFKKNNKTIYTAVYKCLRRLSEENKIIYTDRIVYKIPKTVSVDETQVQEPGEG